MSRFNKQWQDDEDEEEGPDGDDDFDYDEFVENEFGEGSKQSQYSPLIRYTTIVLLVMFVASVVLQFWG